MSCVWNYQKKGKRRTIYPRRLGGIAMKSGGRLLHVLQGGKVVEAHPLEPAAAPHPVAAGDTLPPETQKALADLSSVSAFAFDGKSIRRFGQSVKGWMLFLTFCTNRKRMGKENFGRHHFSPLWSARISIWSSRLIRARSAKVAASGMTDSRFCRRKVLAISADMRNSSAVVRPVLIS